MDPREIVSPVRNWERERWLSHAARLLELEFLANEGVPPLRIRTDFGMKANGRPADGLCWDDAPECRIDIAGELREPTYILAVLLHEMLHAVVGPELLHNGAYRPLFTAVGFRGAYVGCLPSRRLQDGLREVARRLGPYPA